MAAFFLQLQAEEKMVADERPTPQHVQPNEQLLQLDHEITATHQVGAIVWTNAEE